MSLCLYLYFLDLVSLMPSMIEAWFSSSDMADLEKGLQESQDGRSRLIVTDGVFSMDGEA